MKYLKYIILFLSLLFFSTTSFADVNQTYYVTSTGDATDPDCSGGGAPNCAGAWDEADIEDSANWSTSDDVAKIDPGDTVYFGSDMNFSTNMALPSGVGGDAAAQVIFDGYAGGSCDAYTDSCTNGVNITDYFYLNGNHHITFRDFDFQSSQYSIFSPEGTKSYNIIITNNNFSGTSQATVVLNLIDDTIAFNNRFNNISTKQNYLIGCGKGNMFIHNYISGGKTGMMLRSNFSSSTTFHALEDNIIAGNYATGVTEEVFSMDCIGNQSSQVCALENDTVDSDDGSYVITLADGGWSGYSDRDYDGYYMMFLDGTLAGNMYEITGHSEDEFTFAEDISAVSNGDRITIVFPFLNNYHGFNTVTDYAWEYSTNLVYGAGYGNIIEYNTSLQDDGAAIRSLTGLAAADNSATGTCGEAPAFNTLAYMNDFDDENAGTTKDNIQATWADKDVCNPGNSFNSYYNTFIDNVLGYGVVVNNQYYYASGNTGSIYSSGTTSNNIAYKYKNPYITGTPVINANSTVTINWSEGVTLGGYTNGDFYLTTDTDIFSAIDLNDPSGSDATYVFSTGSEVIEGGTYKLWFKGTDGSVINAAGNKMIVVGFKTITNNAVNAVYNVSPGDNDTGVSITTTATWDSTFANDDVFLKEASCPASCDTLVSNDDADNSYDMSTLALNTTYCLGFKADGGSEDCQEFEFTTTIGPPTVPSAFHIGVYDESGLTGVYDDQGLTVGQ